METQPEVLAYHYTEASLSAYALPYWQRAGARATARSAYVEAIGHLSAGLAALEALPETPERTLHELHLQVALGGALTAHKGFAAAEAGQAYRRARELAQQVPDTPQLAPVLLGLWVYYHVQAELRTAHELGEELLRVAHRWQEPMLRHQAHHALGITTTDQGVFVDALSHLEQAVTLYAPAHHGAHLALSVYDTGVICRAFAAHNLWYLGYPDQAAQRNQEALTLAQELAHPYSSAGTFGLAATCAALRREWHRAEEWAEAVVALSCEHSFAYFLAWGMIMRGWALSAQGRHGEGLAQLQQGLEAYRTTGAVVLQTCWSALLAEALSKAGQAAAGLHVLDEALATIRTSGEHRSEAELYRFQGELLQQTGSGGPHAAVGQSSPEACFQQALAIARQQQAKSLELRAAMSLARLWQSQGKRQEAYDLLAPIYGWFTEGFDTADLLEAKALLEELA
jgi:predicted ATPase